MMSISSQAGRRLAKCKHALDQALEKRDGSKIQEMAISEAMAWTHAAAEDVANELMASGFHEMEGE